MVKVDCIVRKDTLAWAADSRSEMQLDDARNLIASVPELDWIYIETRAATLGVEALLREVRR